MAVPTLTSANSRFTLTIPGVVPVPSNIKGYATEEAFMVEQVQVAETMIGVDGIMSAAYLPVITPMTVTLQATSTSRRLFELWLAAEKLAKEILPATAGVIQLPSIGMQYLFTDGVLQAMKQVPDAKRTLQPVQYVIHWQNVDYVPIALPF